MNGVDDMFYTLLHYGMWHNLPGVVTSLLSYPDIKLEVTNCVGWTGLRFVCAYNCVSVISIFGGDHRCTPHTDPKTVSG